MERDQDNRDITVLTHFEAFFRINRKIFILLLGKGFKQLDTGFLKLYFMGRIYFYYNNSYKTIKIQFELN